MKVEQIYTGCIAHAAYYVENNGEAAILIHLEKSNLILIVQKKIKLKLNMFLKRISTLILLVVI